MKLNYILAIRRLSKCNICVVTNFLCRLNFHPLDFSVLLDVQLYTLYIVYWYARISLQWLLFQFAQIHSHLLSRCALNFCGAHISCHSLTKIHSPASFTLLQNVRDVFILVEASLNHRNCVFFFISSCVYMYTNTQTQDMNIARAIHCLGVSRRMEKYIGIYNIQEKNTSAPKEYALNCWSE